MIPFPIESLVEGIEGMADPDGEVTGDRTDLVDASRIPQGRSLQSGNADFRDPRQVLVPGVLGITTPRRARELSRRLFIGSSAIAGELEVISWDPSCGCFRFVRVKDYRAGRTPRVEPAADGECLVCHQGGGPIFTRFPWGETDFNPDMSERIAREHGGSTTYAGIRLGRGNDADNVDLAVRGANRLLQARNACRSMCGDDVSCRGFLLRQALTRREPSRVVQFGADPNGLSSDTGRFGEFASVQAGSPLDAFSRRVGAQWPANQFEYPSSVVPDRQLSGQPAVGSRTRPGRGSRRWVPDDAFQTRALVVRGSSPPDYSPTFDDSRTLTRIADGVDVITVADPDFPADPDQLRPMTGRIRPENAVLYAIDVSFDCLGFDAADAAELSGCSTDQISRILADAEVQAALTSWPLPTRDSPASPNLKEIVMGVAARVCAPCPEAGTDSTGWRGALDDFIESTRRILEESGF